MPQPDRTAARRLAAEALARGDAVGWFDILYRQAGGQASLIPWADLEVNPNLVAWLEKQPLAEMGKRTLIVGCGLGDDAEELGTLGFRVTAFDVSTSAIDWCKTRFPKTQVDYVVADLLHPPSSWHRAFDFVFEAYTLQVLPAEVRPQAARSIADCVAPGGILLVIARAREPSEEPGTMPWPLVKHDLATLRDCGLEVASFEDYFDREDPPVRRFRVEYRRGA
jgi:SAM-dependent methyltransferase